MEEKEIIVGIDLGTTNSCIAVFDWDKYKAEVIPNNYGHTTTPSIVHFYDKEYYDIGLDAILFLNSEPKSTIHSIKRIIGLNFNSKEVEIFKKDWCFNLFKQDRNKIGIEIEITKQLNSKINAQKFIINPELISAYILKKLKNDAENFLKGKTVKKAVVAVPHYFNNSQKEATKTAAYMAGFEDVALINEPTAASLALAFNDHIYFGRDKKVVIFDLGGGTFDVSLLTNEIGTIDVICVNGEKLGGDDIDNILCEYIEKKIRESDKFKDLSNLNEIINKQKGKIKVKCQFLKERLSYQDISAFDFKNFYKNKDILIKITRKELEKLCENILYKIKNILDELFKDAKIKKSNSYDKSIIDDIILIGGATKMPLINNFVEKYFGKKPITSSFNEAVAIGAALRGQLFKDYFPLKDVIPLNIGIMEGKRQIFNVFLKQNTYIPCSNKKSFYSSYDYQSKVEMDVYEGNEFCENNTLLGNFTLEITPKKAEDSKIEVSFEINEDLILHVKAKQISEEESNEVSIQRKNQLLTNEELELEKKKIENSKLISNNENKLEILFEKIIKEFFPEIIMNISDYSEKEFNKTEFTILKELNKYYKYYNESKIVNQEYFNNDFDMENYIKHEEIITKKYNNVQLKSIEDDNGGENDDEDNNI